MARLPYLEAADLAAEHRDLLARGINLHKLLAHSPAAARAFSGLGGHIRFGSKLDPRLRELAILQVGYLTKSDYEYSHHIKIGHDFGVTDDDIRALIDETDGKTTTLDPLAKTVLKAAREMTAAVDLSDATFAALKQHMDAETIVELIVAIAFYNGVVRLLSALRIDVEDSYKPYLDKFPLP